jgi:UDP-N-acetylmuramyl pentapeptide phosphotransferase/UDP-N-acetylglucosamine-1-phosphate transferase
MKSISRMVIKAVAIFVVLAFLDYYYKPAAANLGKAFSIALGLFLGELVFYFYQQRKKRG